MSSMVTLLKKVVESFFSKAGEKLCDFVAGSGASVIDFKGIFENLQRNSNRLSDIAIDVETQIKIQKSLGKKKRKREVEQWQDMVQEIPGDFLALQNEYQEKGFFSCILNGDKVSKLNARVEKLVEQSRHFDGLLLDDYGTRGEPLLTIQLFGEKYEQILRMIMECLVTKIDSNIGIYGISGVGKTSLAKHVHNLVLRETQDRIYWIKVSREFSIKNLQDEIAQVVGLTLSHENIEEKRAAALNRALIQRKDFVLILDGIQEAINFERVGFPIGVDGCKLIIMTRSLKVCRQIGCQEYFELKTLDANESWNLFEKTLGHYTKLSPQVEGFAKSMAGQCGGLPGKIVTLAQNMSGVTEVCEWRHALLELGGLHLEGEDV